jgi:soluble lytic murein transglycosylase-like protein
MTPYNPGLTPVPGSAAQASIPNGPAPSPDGNAALVEPGSTGNVPVPMNPPAAGAPGQQASSNSWVGNLLSALNPISSAQADEMPHPSAAASSNAGSGQTAGQAMAGARLPPAALDTDAPASPAASIKAPVKAAVVGTPASSGAIANPTDSTAALPTKAAAVAPGQISPSQQSEAPISYPKDPIDPRPLAALAKSAPDEFNTVNQAAREYDVSPARLAAHWMAESALHTTETYGRPIRSMNGNGSVDIGPMQINSGTLKELDPSGKLNPDDTHDSLELAARYIRTLDGRFGKDTYLSVAAYNGGPGGAENIYAGKGDPAVMHYADGIFMGQRPSKFQPPMSVDPIQFAQTAQQDGPQGAIRMLSQTNPGTSMGDKWRALETAGIYAFMERGDVQGAMGVRDLIQQVSHAGTNQALQGAYQALQAGNGVGASQLLARAHAFVQDGQMGRFGVDDKNQVWGEMLDESTGKPLGKPFQVTPQNLGAMFIQTRDMNKFNDMADKSAQVAASIKEQQDHGDYYHDIISVRRQADADKVQIDNANNATKSAIAAMSAGAGIDRAAMRLGARNPGGAFGLQDPKTQAAVSGELSKPAVTPGVNNITDPNQRGAAGIAYADMRGGGMPAQQADHVTAGLFRGDYVLHAMKTGDYIITDKGGTPVAHVSPNAGHMIGGALRPVAQPRSAIPAPHPYGSSAFPVAAQNAPSSTALQ